MAEGFKVELQREIQKAVDDTLQQAEAVMGDLKIKHNADILEQRAKFKQELEIAQRDIEMCAESNELLQNELDEALSELKKLRAAGNIGLRRLSARLRMQKQKLQINLRTASPRPLRQSRQRVAPRQRTHQLSPCQNKLQEG